MKVNHGTLLDSFTPPVNPPAEIEDPEDSMPADWVFHQYLNFANIKNIKHNLIQNSQDEREKIPDPEASKPDDWDENAPQKIVDESAEKPSGWLDEEPDMIADPDAVRPEDWDDEMDGDWEPALINNLACAAAPGCGPWSRPMIENPAYKVVSWPIIFQSYLIYNLFPDFRS